MSRRITAESSAMSTRYIMSRQVDSLLLQISTVDVVGLIEVNQDSGGVQVVP